MHIFNQTNVGLFLCSLLFIIIEYFLRQRFSCFHSWKQKDGYLWPERWPRKVITWGSMFSLKNGFKRKEIDHWESWLTNVFHVLSMKKIFSQLDLRWNKQHACLIWPTSDQACVSKSIRIYFWIWWLNMQSKEPILAFMSLTGNYPHSGKRWLW